MSLTPEQYLALTQISNQNFDVTTDTNLTISDLIDKYDLPGENKPVRGHNKPPTSAGHAA